MSKDSTQPVRQTEPSPRGELIRRLLRWLFEFTVWFVGTWIFVYGLDAVIGESATRFVVSFALAAVLTYRTTSWIIGRFQK